jgi:hypothetical protein
MMIRQEVSVDSTIDNGKRLFSLQDSSKRLGGYSVHSLRRHVRLGNIKGIYLVGRLFIPLSEIERIERFGFGQPRARKAQAACVAQ